MDDRTMQVLKNIEQATEELKSMSNLLERVAASNEEMLKVLQQMMTVYRQNLTQVKK